jgi:hypothetical protein
VATNPSYFVGRFNIGFAEEVNLKIKTLTVAAMATAISTPFAYTFWSLLNQFPIKNGGATTYYSCNFF